VEFDAGEGDWRTGYAELGVGCETCHGPSVTHVITDGDADFALNPRDLDDGTVDGRRRANAVCTQCHDRGTGATLPGAPAPVEYPWRVDGPFVAGETLDGALVRTSDPADFHGYRDNPLSSTPTPGKPSDDTFVAARSGWMQGIEHDAGGHAATSDGAPLCFDCHDPHGEGGPSMLVTRFPRTPDLAVSDSDGTLCLACHAGSGPFTGLERSAVETFARGGRVVVGAAVVRHMADSGMAVPASAYDPEGTGVGRCSTCHMAATGTGTRATIDDAAGFPRSSTGGGSHTMRTLWPSVSVAHDMTNGCNRCHSDLADDAAGRNLAAWRSDGADGDGDFHGRPARRFQRGRLGDAAGDGAACIRCHTTQGFRRIVIEGDVNDIESDADARTAVILDAVRYDEGVTCAACHGLDGSGLLSAERAPLRLPRQQLCNPCHGDGVTFEDYDLVAAAPHAPQVALFDGAGGAEPPGSGPYEDGAHTEVADGCVHCHLDPTDPHLASHTFEPSVDTCRQCHSNPTSFDLVAFGDYDGDGTVEGLQTEVRDLVALVRDAILAADAAVTFDSEEFERGAGPAMTGATPALKRAAFNIETVLRDRSGGLHNPTRIVRLLQRSYREVTGQDVPGATLR
jgi:mono/diheme cytochrome c family protein